MNVKQRFSVAVSTLLPALALVGYLSLSPAKVQASSCPDGEVYAPAPSGYCNQGEGGLVRVGATSPFVFCQTEEGQPQGQGMCVSTACVSCTYGYF
ncbi:MAG TPA: hypothetical protein VIJ65_01895 [Acidobacteriaceae bacterium]